MERLPGFAPKLNPRVWKLLTRRFRKNLCAADFEPLAMELVRLKEWLMHRKTVLRQCLAHAGFPPLGIGSEINRRIDELGVDERTFGQSQYRMNKQSRP